MKKAIKYTVITIVLTVFLFILGVKIWYGYLEYYWHTETFTLYQKDGIVRLCNESTPLNPSWNETAENKIQLESAANLVKQGLPITISGRGGISKSTFEVFVDRIIKIEAGVNPECEKY